MCTGLTVLDLCLDDLSLSQPGHANSRVEKVAGGCDGGREVVLWVWLAGKVDHAQEKGWISHSSTAWILNNIPVL